MASDSNPGKAKVFKDTESNIKLFMKLYDTFFLDNGIVGGNREQKKVEGLDSIPPTVAFALVKILEKPLGN